MTLTQCDCFWSAASWASMAEPLTLELPDGRKRIIDPPVDPYGDGYVRTARVEIRADGLEAHTSRGQRHLRDY